MAKEIVFSTNQLILIERVEDSSAIFDVSFPGSLHHVENKYRVSLRELPTDLGCRIVAL